MHIRTASDDILTELKYVVLQTEVIRHTIYV